MTRDLTMWALTVLTLMFVSSAHAGTITPDLAPVPISPRLGAVAAGGRVTDQFKAFGVIFSDGVATAIFDDPPLAFGGINLAGTVDLVTPVNGFLVIPGTTTLTSTNFLSVEAGLTGEGNLLLQVFDVNRVLLGSTVNDDGLGPHDRTLMTLRIPGIAFFSVSSPGGNTFGVDQLDFNGGELSTVPEPGALLLLGSSLIGLVGYGRTRRRKT
jgi:PEP-CTERM motif